MRTQDTIACALSPEVQDERGLEIADLFAHADAMRELPDGYALRFPGEGAWGTRLLGFIAGERECCPFFAFTLAFEPERGPIWLHLCGGEGVKEFVGELLAASTAKHQ